MKQRSDLPFGSEFSPSQIKLRRVLELARTYGDMGNWKAFESAVREKYFENHNTNDYNKSKLANNTRLGMIAYGIIERNAKLTEFGEELYTVREEEVKLYKKLAQHILLHLHGMSLVSCIKEMGAAGEKVDLTSIRERLALKGVRFPRGGKHPSMMRLWLAKAGVFAQDGWRIDDAKLRDVLGRDANEFEALARFTPGQRAFLMALANMGTTEPQPANKIAKLASATYGVKFPEKSLPKLVLNSLVDAGYVKVTKTTTGRGAKPFLVAPTEKLTADVILPFFEQLQGRIESHLLDLLRRPLSDIVSKLSSADRFVAGLALEALAFKLMRLLDMDYVATRLRAQATGGAEVDLIFESARLVFSRWQIQCKNTSRVAIDEVAKEVGLTHLLKSTVIVIVSTGEIGQEARRYANKVMADSNLCLVMIDRRDVDCIIEDPSEVIGVFNREARHAMILKKIDI